MKKYISCILTAVLVLATACNDEKKNDEAFVDAPVSLTTNEASDVTPTSAILGGNITDAGTPEYTERGVCYATTTNPTVAEHQTPIEGTGTGEFSIEANNLDAGTTYYVRAYATNALATVYGNEISFSTPEPEPEPEPFSPLSNTHYLLTVQKKLKVAYLGGSITKGAYATNWETNWAKAWAGLTTQWLKENYPDAAITEVNAGIGSTGSLYGAARMKSSLMTPSVSELVFVEFAFNDRYQNYTRSQSERNMESIVREIRAANPYADIVLIFVYDADRQGMDYDNITAFKNVAAHYGLLTVNVGEMMRNEYSNDLNAVKIPFFNGDICHPNDAGHAKYAAYIQEVLVKHLTGGSMLQQQEHPQPLHADALSNFKLITPPLSSLTPRNSVLLSFTGTAVGMYWELPVPNPGVTMKVDNGATVNIPDDGDGRINHQRLLYDGLNNGSHTLTLTNNSNQSMMIHAIFSAE